MGRARCYQVRGQGPHGALRVQKGETMGHLLATTYTTTSSRGGFFALLFVGIAFYIVTSLGAYGSYKKAGPYGDPAWAAFVPLYQFIVLLRIAGRPKSWGWF